MNQITDPNVEVQENIGGKVSKSDVNVHFGFSFDRMNGVLNNATK